MKVYKNSERVLDTKTMIKIIKANNSEVKNLGEFSKWADLTTGGRIQKTMTVYEVKNNDLTGYFLSDSLGRMACQVETNKAEVFGWLKKHGYKTTHKWYIEDYGMDEETWKIWNGEEE